MNTTKLEEKIEYNERLLNAFGGSIDGWEFTGIVNDAKGGNAQCCCGHPIRFEFVWKHLDGRQLITGSTCVENAPFVNQSDVEAMKAKLEELKHEQKEAARKARIASQEKEVLALREKCLALIESLWGEKVKEARATYGYLTSPLYSASYNSNYYSRMVRASKHLKTPKGQSKRLENILSALETFTGEET